MYFSILFPLFAVTCQVQGADEWAKVSALLKDKCYRCHSYEAKKAKGKLAFDHLEEFQVKIVKDSDDGVIVSGDLTNSRLFRLVNLPAEDSDVMPPDRKDHLTEGELLLLKTWIDAGAEVGEHPVNEQSSVQPVTVVAGPLNWNGMLAWDRVDGESVSAQFIRLEKPFVVLRTIDGTDHYCSLNQLAPASLKQAEEASQYAIPQ